jgi:hypothetical protein
MIILCLWDVESSGQSNMCGCGRIDIFGCYDWFGKTTLQMQTQTTYTSVDWDFVDETYNGIWRLCNTGTEYPQLNWQFPAGDFTCPDGVTLVDFSVLGLAWLSDPCRPEWNLICDISDPNDNFIDELDLDVFTDNYLTGF